MLLDVRDALAGKRLLVTGVTGFVAKVFVAFLLDRVPSIGRITLLTRGRRGQTPAERVQRIVERSPVFRPLRERYGAALGELVRSRLEVVEGDARKPLLGIDQAHMAELFGRIDCVVHVAGLTDFVPDPKDGIAVNVRGAIHAADVAARTRGALLLHVSTGFVAGKFDGRVEETIEVGLSPNGTRFDPSSELASIESQIEASSLRYSDAAEARRARIEAGQQRANALGWPNLYTYGKALAEQMIAHRTDVRTVVVRPSIVECARSFPFTGWNEGLNTSGPLVWLVGTLHRRMPFAKDHCFDVIPVDTIARGMTLVLAEMLVGDPAPVYQLASGDVNRFTFGRALDLTALARRRQYQRSEDLFERLVLGHMDSVIAGKPASSDAMLPTARAVTKAARDALVAFDPDTHLPAAIRSRFGAQLGKLAQRAGKELGVASRTMGQVEEMLRLYQPFVWDHDAELVTERVRALSARLAGEERELFGWDVETLDWRSYWLDVQIPGLDRWSLPVLRGERVHGDPPFDLGECVREVGGVYAENVERGAHERALASLEEGAE